ncbi:MAG: tetratricopeptide repeat protein [Gammaproteobacteria bacterium]|nr:tetratricopeptide repeat protein [Gammaproteobacteria bacterium]
MKTSDSQGNELNGATPQAGRLYDEALEGFNIYRGDPLALADAALDAAPGFVMARVLKAHLLALATEPAATAEAAAIVEGLRGMTLDARERSHVTALDLLVGGEWTRAAVQLDHHNTCYPLDLLALQSGHLVDFFRANARNLRDRIARVLPRWSAPIPGHAIVLGMYAFGLEETGDLERAEEFGRRAVDLEPRGCWAHHAVAHVLEMQGRAGEGVQWMASREPLWSGEDNYFQMHNWWHRALFHLDLGQHDEVLALYDGVIRPKRGALAVELVDASALLWRMHLSGMDVGDRWGEVAAAWVPHADGRGYPFNDWHAAMAWLGAGREVEVERLLAGLRATTGDTPETAVWGRRIGLPLIEGFSAFWRGDYRGAVEALHPARFIANAFGGSHAQRDIIDWTLTEAALGAGLDDLARALAHERLALKPHSPVNLGLLRRTGGNGAGLVAAA